MHVSSRHQHGHTSPTSCYSRNHDTRFILSTLLTPQKYSPYGKLFACRSKEDDDVRVCDIRTGQLTASLLQCPTSIKSSTSALAMCMFSAGTQDGASRWNQVGIWSTQWSNQNIQPNQNLRHSGPRSQAPEWYSWICAYPVRHQGWMVDGPGRLEYREALCLAHAETIWGWPIWRMILNDRKKHLCWKSGLEPLPLKNDFSE